MATTSNILRDSKSFVPFLSKKLSFVRGLDPLGLSNTSDATFSMLLPGLNNVTGRIRYYSFYCWLLSQYEALEMKKEQRFFIRKAEYLVALIAQTFEKDIPGIPGSNYAFKRYEEEETTTFNLDEGVGSNSDKTDGTYWKYSWGAFGQYYLGSLRDIGLISEKSESIAIHSDLRVSPQDLSTAFHQNLSEEDVQSFIECILKGSVSRKELDALKNSFNLSKVPVGTEEEKLLLNLLLQLDHPTDKEKKTIHRNTTIRQLLSSIELKGKIKDRQFVVEAFNKRGVFETGEAPNPTYFGWYYYQVNEYWTYANTAILNGLLHELATEYQKSWVPIQRLTHALSTALFVDGQRTFSEYLSEQEFNLESLKSDIDKSSGGERALHGFRMIFGLYRFILSDLDKLYTYGLENNLLRSGNAPGFFSTLFKQESKGNLDEFIQGYLQQHIIQRHQMVAFRKMGSGTLSTEKFVVEEGLIRYIDNFEPAYTGPRIGNLLSFLKDLNVFSEEFELNSSGKELLKSEADEAVK
jgi:hypothetical protein